MNIVEVERGQMDSSQQEGGSRMSNDPLMEFSERGLTLATLCDMVLDEDADDRSDDALIRGVGMLQREVERLREELEQQRLAVEMTYEAAQSATREADAEICERIRYEYRDIYGDYRNQDRRFVAQRCAKAIRDRQGDVNA